MDDVAFALNAAATVETACKARIGRQSRVDIVAFKHRILRAIEGGSAEQVPPFGARQGAVTQQTDAGYCKLAWTVTDDRAWNSCI